MLKFQGASFILVSNCAFQRSSRICSQDRHTQVQHWLRHAQPQNMHAQHWPRTLSRSRYQGREGRPHLPCSHWGPRPRLSMQELSLSMPEPKLSPSMLILAKPGQSKLKFWLTKVLSDPKTSNFVEEMSGGDGLG